MIRRRSSHFVLGAAAAAISLAGTQTPPAHAADGPVHVLTTTTDLADIVRTVGGDMVVVESLCSGPEDPHFLDARPSYIRMAANAEMLVIVGLEFEVGYLPLMLRDGSNPAIHPGKPGYVDASTRIKKLQVPEGGAPSRALGDVHRSGNPHYLYDPANAVIVADEVAEALKTLRPASSAAFAERAKAFRGAITELLLGAPPKDDPKGKRVGGMIERFKPFEGAPIITYHDDLIYLAHRLGLEVLGTLEPKPGVPPTAQHLGELAEQAKAAKVKAVCHEVFQNAGQVRSFASGVGAQPVVMAHQPGATADAKDLLSMYRRNADALFAALSVGGAGKAGASK